MDEHINNICNNSDWTYDSGTMEGFDLFDFPIIKLQMAYSPHKKWIEISMCSQDSHKKLISTHCNSDKEALDISNTIINKFNGYDLKINDELISNLEILLRDIKIKEILDTAFDKINSSTSEELNEIVSIIEHHGKKYISYLNI